MTTTLRIDGLQLSHELRTPLNAILGHLELLLDGSAGPLGADARASVAEVRSASQTLLRRVETLLALCQQPDGARVVVRDDDLDLVALFSQAFTQAEVGDFAITPANATLKVRGDRDLIGALAAALVDLASGHPTRLELRGEPVDADGGGADLLFSWPGFRPEDVAPLPIAAISSISARHQATSRITPRGLQIHWPFERLVRSDRQAEPVALTRPDIVQLGRS